MWRGQSFKIIKVLKYAGVGVNYSIGYKYILGKYYFYYHTLTTHY